MRRLVILGGGTAGTAVANRLRSAIPEADLRITVIDQDDEHHYQPGYLFRAVGTYSSSQIVRSRHRLFASGIELVLTAIDKVEPKRKRVVLTDGRAVPYDLLIIATGVTPRPDQTPGMDGPEYGVSIHQFYTLDGAEKLHEALRHFRGGKMVVHLTDLPIKCPVAPLEMTFLLDAWLTGHGIREETTITYVTPLDGAFTKPVASRELGNMFLERGIDLVTDFAVESVDNTAKQLVSYDERRVDFDLLVTIPLNLGADYIARSGMGDDLNLVPCDQHTMAALDYPDTWVLGDAGTLATSKAGSVAHFSIDVFMENFMAAWRGEEPEGKFDGHANCFVETGHGKGMLLDFNYKTQPLTGVFPFPGVGPMKLLKESRINHLGKLGFYWVYWHLLLPGRRIPIPADMKMSGKIVPSESADSAAAPSAAAPAAIVAPKEPAAAESAPAAPARKKPATPKPAAKAASSEVLDQPIIPTF